MSADTVAGFSIFDVFRVLFRHKWKCLIIFCLIFGAVCAYTLLSPKTYRSEGKLFVRLGRENTTTDPTSMVGQAPAVVPQSRETEINSVLEILQSRLLVENVVDQLGPQIVLDRLLPQVNVTANGTPVEPKAPGVLSRLRSTLQDYGLVDRLPERAQAILDLTDGLQISAVRKSNVIAVSYEAYSPEAAQTVVQSVIEAAQEQHIKAHRPPHSQQFLTQQTTQLRDQMGQLEEQLRDLKTSTGLASLADQRQILVQRIGHLEDEALATAAALTAADSQVREMQKALAKIPEELTLSKTTGFPNEGADLMRNQLYTLQIKEQELLAKYKPEHPDVIAVQEQIREAQTLLANEDRSRTQEAKGPNTVHQAAKSALLAQEPVVASLRAKAQELSKQIIAAKGTLKTLNDNEVLIARMTRELELADVKYRKYSENLEQARMDAELEQQRISNISIVEPATFEPKSVRPRKLMNLGLGLVMAFVSALGIALVCEFSGTSLVAPSPVNGQAVKPHEVTVVNLNRGTTLPHEPIAESTT